MRESHYGQTRRGAIVGLTMWCCVAGVAGCGASTDKTVVSPEGPKESKSVWTVENGGRKLEFSTPPKRVIATGQGAAELLLQLGQADAIAGIYYGRQAPVAADLEEQFKGLKVLSETAPPSKETALALKPDLVVAQFPTADLEPSRGAASQSDFEQAGASVFLYSATSGNVAEATYENFLNDVIALGKIFQVESKAQKLVDEARRRLEAARSSAAEMPRIKTAIVFMASEQGLGVFGSGMLNDLCQAANLENVYGREKDSLINTSREDFATRDIECFIIPDFSEVPARRARLTFDWLAREFPDLPASRNKRYVAIGIEKLNVGLRNVEAVEQLVREARSPAP